MTTFSAEENNSFAVHRKNKRLADLVYLQVKVSVVNYDAEKLLGVSKDSANNLLHQYFKFE